MRSLFAAAALLASFAGAYAADLAGRPAPMPVSYTPSNWTAVYLGGFAGGTRADVNFSDPAASASGTVKSSGFVGGVYGGFDYELPNRVVVGAKITAPLTGNSASTTVFSIGPPAPSSGKVQWATNLSVTAGYDLGPWMPYVGAGVAYLSNRITLGGTAGQESDTQLHTGLNLLAGAKYRFTQNWAAGIQYSHTEYSGQTYTFPRNLDSGVVKISANSLVGTLEFRY